MSKLVRAYCPKGHLGSLLANMRGLKWERHIRNALYFTSIEDTIWNVIKMFLEDRIKQNVQAKPQKWNFVEQNAAEETENEKIVS